MYAGVPKESTTEFSAVPSSPIAGPKAPVEAEHAVVRVDSEGCAVLSDDSVQRIAARVARLLKPPSRYGRGSLFG